MTDNPEQATPAGTVSPSEPAALPPTDTETTSPPPARAASPPSTQEQGGPAPPGIHTVIEADGAYDDGTSDAGYESDTSSRATTSISSSVRDYTFEANRRYHKFQEGRYQFPNDDSEQEREVMKHAMVVNLCGGKLHFAPLENPQKIIDLGTGTGVWAIDSERLCCLALNVANLPVSGR